MERFYVFVRTVYRYNRSKKQPKDGLWLRQKINDYGKHNLQEKDIEKYCYLFEILLYFCRFKPLDLRYI